MKRIACAEREEVRIAVDGAPLAARAGDTVLTALVAAGVPVRQSEFTGRPRAGFCLMGACQDCWVRLGSGDSIRACSTMLLAGMTLHTERNAP